MVGERQHGAVLVRVSCSCGLLGQGHGHVLMGEHRLGRVWVEVRGDGGHGGRGDGGDVGKKAVTGREGGGQGLLLLLLPLLVLVVLLLELLMILQVHQALLTEGRVLLLF